MSDLQQVLLTFLLTVLGGAALLVVGQVIIRFYVDPLIEQKKAIAQVHNALRFYSNIITSPGVVDQEQRSELTSVLRQTSVSLQVSTHSIPTYRVFEALHLVPTLSQIRVASTEIMALSISLRQGEELANLDRIQSVLARLRLPSL